MSTGWSSFSSARRKRAAERNEELVAAFNKHRDA